MRHHSTRKGSVLFLLGCVLLCIASLAYLFIADRGLFSFVGKEQGISHTFGIASPEAGRSDVIPETSTHLAPCKQQAFQAGVAFPQWDPMGYGSGDTKWQMELSNIRTQTNACWLEMPILFVQNTLYSTDVKTGPSTPTVANFSYGVRAAHALGYHVFVTPLLDVNGAQSWSGAIQFSTYQQEQQWFESYWQVIKPYVMAAAQTGVEQLSIGTEYEWLQKFAPDSLWNGLIANIRSLFSGTLTYDMNWTTLQMTPPVWMHNSNLKVIGVSAYLSLVETPTHIDPKQVFALWRSTVKPLLDNFSVKIGKPIILSEIGYRNSSDALYHSWEAKSSAPADPKEQAAACDAALANSISDQHILGSFFWGWDDVGAFSLKGQPAVAVLHNRYASLHN